MLSLIAALTTDRVIGKDNSLLWHIPEDLKLFKKHTKGKPVIMGRKTFDSILGYLKKPLPGRLNIVLTSSAPKYEDFDNLVIVHTKEEALNRAQEEAKKTGQEEVFVIGGAQIYKLFLNECDSLYLSYVKKSYEGDTFFPEFSVENFAVVQEQDYEDFTFKKLERKKKN